MESHIYVEGVIGDDWFADNPITLKNVRSQINEESENLILHIDSPGGYTSDAWAIHDYIRLLDKPTTAIINGMCASAATIIAAACDEIHMTQNSEFMIHLPWVIAMGNSDDMEEIVKMLRDEERKIARLYADYTGSNIRAMRNLMAKEEFWDAEKAKKEGFIDKVLKTNRKKKQTSNLKAIATIPEMSKEMKVAACINRNQININMSEKKKNQGFLAKLKNLVAEIDEPEVKDLHLTLADGREMEVLNDATEPAVGDEVLVDNGAAEDGEYVTNLGDSITVKDSFITAINKYQPKNAKEQGEKIVALEKSLSTVQNELKAQKDANAQLQTKLEESTNSYNALKASNEAISQKMDKVINTLKAVSSEGNGELPDSQEFFTSQDATNLNKTEMDFNAGIEEIRKQNKQKAKANA